MSTVTVSNINSPNSSIPFTLASGNTSAGAIVVSNESVDIVINSTTNATINTTSMYINSVDVITPYAGQATKTVVFSGNVTPTTLTSNTSAYNPDSTDIAYVIRVSANSTSNTANTAYGPGYEPTIFGISAGTNGQIYTIQNIGSQKINFKKEDSTTETTAANRFNFPNDISLGGYMSMEIYYDGTLQRWRMVDSVNIPFDHKYSLTKGFFAGGQTVAPTTVTTADRTTYSTETTAAVAGAALTVARFSHASTGNADKGFFSGGQAPTQSATADRTTYSSETTAAVAGANLSQARYLLAASGNADKGFFSGGNTPAVATADRTTYSTETTAAVAGANLSQARYDLAAVGNADKGFYTGGYVAPAGAVTADRTTYSTETTAAVAGANLTAGRYYHTGAGNSDKGFFAGGISPTVVSSYQRTTYSTETTAGIATTLSSARSQSASAGNSDKGFFSGGLAPTAVATADRTTYSTETTAAVTGANLSQARYNYSAI